MLTAQRDEIIVKVNYEETIGRIFIVDDQKASNADFWGEVVSVGPEYKYNVNVGDRLHFQRNEGHPIDVDGQRYYAIKPRAILAVERP